MSEEEYYALGMEVNGRLVFLSDIDMSGEVPNIKFTDNEKEIRIDSDLDAVQVAQMKLRDAGIDVEIINVSFEEGAENE